MSHQKDSQWLQLDVCPSHQLGTCLLSPADCKLAHPLPHVDISPDAKVMACYDSFKGRCRRVTCKFYHPTQPLMEVLLARGRTHLAMKNQNLQFFDVTEATTSRIEVGVKRSAENHFEMMYFKRPTMAGSAVMPMMPQIFQSQPIFQPQIVPQPQAVPITIVPTDREYFFNVSGAGDGSNCCLKLIPKKILSFLHAKL